MHTIARLTNQNTPGRIYWHKPPKFPQEHIDWSVYTISLCYIIRLYLTKVQLVNVSIDYLNSDGDEDI